MKDTVNLTIVTYNRLECTKRCLASIFEHTNHPFVLTLIDNNSEDGTQEYLMSLLGNSLYAKHINRIVLLDNNMGISPAYNLGWVLSDTPYYMKIDNDVQFLRSDWLQSLVRVAEGHRDAAMIGFGKNSSGLRREDRDELYYQGHIGGCTFIRRDVHDALGFWNEDYGLYGEEDADFGLRARLAGYCNLTLFDGRPFLQYVDNMDANYQDYRQWKGQERKRNVNGMFVLNDVLFKCGFRDLKVDRMYIPTQNGDSYVFMPDKEYLIKLESFKRKYIPLIPQIQSTKEFAEIQEVFNFFY